MSGGMAVVILLAFVKLLVHVLTASNYGYFRDELYYMAAGRHLAFGYVDFPPFVALVAPLRACCWENLCSRCTSFLSWPAPL